MEKIDDKQLEKLQHLWLLFAALNAANYALVQLDISKTFKHNDKMRFVNLKDSITNFLKQSQIIERSGFDLQNFENVGAMAETIALVSQIPPDKIDWYLSECNKLVIKTVTEPEV